MFVLKPNGNGGGAGPSQRKQILAYFGQLGLYFGAIRMAYAFWAGREANQAAIKE